MNVAMVQRTPNNKRNTATAKSVLELNLSCSGITKNAKQKLKQNHPDITAGSNKSGKI
jgi:hypothetical protein